MKSIFAKGICYFLDLIFPIQCLWCGIEGEWLCQKCFGEIKISFSNHCPFCESKTYFGATCERCRQAHFLDGAISCVPYSNPIVQTILHAWKYDEITQMTEFVAATAIKSLTEAKKQSENLAKKFSIERIQKNILKFYLACRQF